MDDSIDRALLDTRDALADLLLTSPRRHRRLHLDYLDAVTEREAVRIDDADLLAAMRRIRAEAAQHITTP